MLALKAKFLTLLLSAVALTAAPAPLARAQTNVPPPPGVLEGVVVRQATTPTTPPTPVAGATVQVFPALTPNPGTVPIREGLTDDHGRFRFEGLPAGSYHVRASKEGVGTGQAGAQLTHSAGARVHIVLTAVPPPPPPGPGPGVLEGLVVRQSLAPTPQPIPVAGATVRVFRHLAPTTTPVRHGTTDEHGRFRFEGLNPGAYLVVAFKDGVGEGRTQATLTETHGARVTVMLIPPPPPPPPPPAPGVLEGTVFAATATGPVPAPGASVAVFALPLTPTPTPPVRTGTTDKHGNFTFEGLKPGRYHVVAHREGLGRGHAYALLTVDFGARVRILLRNN